MKFLLLFALLACSLLHSYAQHNFKAIVQDSSSKELLNGATILLKNNPQRAAATNGIGFVQINNIPAGKYTIEASFNGYKTAVMEITLPDSTIHYIMLMPDATKQNDVVIVSSTRGNERIENAVTKVEVLGIEEMNEETTIKPGNIASILGDVSGVQIQQSSATTGNANVRIQGLGGKYTQILKDGMPLYGGFAGGFGILSIPPLDLKQVELIKGSSSTLYGGGAIGGLVNLISKKPSYEPEASFLINQSTLQETNINTYYAQRWKKIGFTFFAGQTLQKQVDVNNDGFSDVAKDNNLVIHPTLFIYPTAKSSIALSWNASIDNRMGGDMVVIADKATTTNQYFEKNVLHRNIFSILAEHKLSKSLSLFLKSSVSIFNRQETTNTYAFTGNQNNYYNELSFLIRAKKHTIVGGINVNGDAFTPSINTPVPIGSFNNNIVGAFIQDGWQLFKNTKLETGIRYDHHNKYGDFILPRVALFYRINEHWGSRAGFGMGYITPNPLSAQIKDYSIYQLQRISNTLQAEKSYAFNAEANYKTNIGDEGSILINHAFFITQINKPITDLENFGAVNFVNQSKPIVTKGFDTYIQCHIKDIELYIGYTYTEALRTYLPTNQFIPITPRHRAAATLVYEIEDKWRFGVEASYNGAQYREDNSKTPSYVFVAALIERKFGPKWSIVLNWENITDARQSRYESLYTGTTINPAFKTLWAPIDGSVLNMSIRFKPFEKKDK